MNRSERGFTLVEMAIVVLLMGLIMAFAIPTFRKMRQSHDVKGARDNVVAQLQMSRAKAIASGTDQTLHFFTGTYGYDYHTHTAGQPIVGWNLPRGVTYQWPMGSDMTVIMKKDGRADNALVIPITNTRGTRDTVTVMASGLVYQQ